MNLQTDSSATDKTQAGGSVAPLSVTVIHHLNRFALLLGTGLAIIVFSALSPAFLSTSNILNILVQSSALLIVAAPLALLLIAGQVDLSVGSTLALSGVIAGQFAAQGNPALAIVMAIVAGAAVGIFNGIAVAVAGWSAIIVTLGALTAVRGLALHVAPSPVFDFDDSFLFLGQGKLLGIPVMVLIAAVVVTICAIVLSWTPRGRHLSALGVNERAAYVSGINVRRIKFSSFVWVGVAAGIAGIVTVSRLNSAPSASLGSGFELDVLTAILLGGVAFSGGRGTIFGVFLGVLLLGVLQNGLTLLNVPLSTSLLIKGLALVMAAGLDWMSERSLLRRALGS